MCELNVKVGDRVLVKTNSLAYGSSERIAIVEKITPTGRIRVSGSSKQFDKYGTKIGKSDWSYSCSINPISEKEVLEFEERQKKKSVISKAYNLCRKINIEDLTYEQAAKIIEILHN